MAPNLFLISVMLSNKTRDNIITNKKGPSNNTSGDPVECEWGQPNKKRAPLIHLFEKSKK